MTKWSRLKVILNLKRIITISLKNS